MIRLIKLPVVILLSITEVILRIGVRMLNCVVGLFVTLLAALSLVSIISHNWIGLGILLGAMIVGMLLVYGSATIIGIIEWLKDLMDDLC